MKKDLENYLLTLEKQYNEMKKAADEANELLTKGEMSAEQANMIQKFMDNINTNYQRVLYCRHLVNLPPRFIQKLQNKKIIEELKRFKAEHADEESVVEETQKSLDGIKEQLPVEVEDETCGD